MTYNDFFLYVGGAISCLNLCAFAWRIGRGKDKPQSPASWLIWTILDSLLTITSWYAEKPIWLPLSYVVGAASIMMANFRRSAWAWSWRESLCATGAAVSTYVWLSRGPEAGLYASVTAMTFAGLPLLFDLIRHPVRKTFPVWAWTVVACVFTLVASDGTFAGTLLPWCGIIFNGALCAIVLRDKNPA